MLVFPNPVNSLLYVYLQDYTADATVNIINHVGQNIRQIRHLQGQQFAIKTEDIADGIYLLELTTGAVKSVKKFIKINF